MSRPMLNRMLFPLLLLAGILPAWAGGIEVSDAWVREGPPTARVLGAFMTIRNSGDADDALRSVTSPQFERVEMHRTIMEDGMGRMVPQQEIAIPAAGQAVLEPGGYHLMLIRPRHALKAGDQVELTLEFASGQRIDLQLPVRKGGSGMMDHSHHH